MIFRVLKTGCSWYSRIMLIRPGMLADYDNLLEIDGTVDSQRYLHLERAGTGMAIQWRLEDRPLRAKLIQSNPLDDEKKFLARQILSGSEDGIVLVAEHEEAIVAMLMAQVSPVTNALRLIDVRIDFDFRRQGLATAMIFQIIQHAREQAIRAVMAETRTNNHPVNQLLAKTGFELAGVDAQRYSNHDMVKEAATLFWYVAMD
jgi:RimJ/RimL family protein N-acetyltransferase